MLKECGDVKETYKCLCLGVTHCPQKQKKLEIHIFRDSMILSCIKRSLVLNQPLPRDPRTRFFFVLFFFCSTVIKHFIMSVA